MSINIQWLRDTAANCATQTFGAGTIIVDTTSWSLRVHDGITAGGYKALSSTLIGVANGIAGLDGNGKVPLAQMPTSVFELIGFWNASTNAPSLSSGTAPTGGNLYIVSTAGTTNLDGVSQWNPGDQAYFTNGAWHKIDGASNVVSSVAGRTGNVTISTTDISGLGSIATQAASAISVSGGTISGLTSLGVTGNATVGGTLGVTGATTLSTLSTTGNATHGGTLGVTGATTLAGLNATTIVASASMSTVNNSNGPTGYVASNSSTGTSAYASVACYNGSHYGALNIYGTGFTANGIYGPNVTVVQGDGDTGLFAGSLVSGAGVVKFATRGNPAIVGGFDSSLVSSGNHAVYADANGYLTNTASDARLKRDIADAPYGLADVLALQPRIWWWQDEARGTGRQVGFVAQEFQSVMPEAICTNGDGTLSAPDPVMLGAVLVNAIKELAQRTAALEARKPA